MPEDGFPIRGKPDWWVYENWAATGGGRARAHYGICSHCNHGEGIHLNPSGRNSRWHGPFPDSVEAMVFARGLGRADTRICARCLKYVRA